MSSTCSARHPVKSPPCACWRVTNRFCGDWRCACLRQILLGDDEELLSSLDGNEVAWKDVSDELHTASLFGPAGRVVLINNADDFVSKQRPQLEDYVAAPHQGSTLILSVKSWPATTRLAKAVGSMGLTVTCGPPLKNKSKNKKIIDRPKLVAWIRGWALSAHGLKLQAGAAEQLVEIVGDELGIVDQELAKLALMVDDPGRVSGEEVVQIVGGWRTRTTWELLDAVCDGNAGEALALLDRMLGPSEHAVALFGAFSWSLRRFAAVTRLVQQSERSGQRSAKRAQVQEALQQIWGNYVPAEALRRAEKQLRQIRRERAGEILSLVT